MPEQVIRLPRPEIPRAIAAAMWSQDQERLLRRGPTPCGRAVLDQYRVGPMLQEELDRIARNKAPSEGTIPAVQAPPCGATTCAVMAWRGRILSEDRAGSRFPRPYCPHLDRGRWWRVPANHIAGVLWRFRRSVRRLLRHIGANPSSSPKTTNAGNSTQHNRQESTLGRPCARGQQS